MRSRNIKPGFFKNELLAECEPLARILFQGLWCLADRNGELEDRPRRIRAEVLPFDLVDAEPLLKQLADRGFITRDTISGIPRINIPAFLVHQRPHPSEPVKFAAQQGNLTAFCNKEGGQKLSSGEKKEENALACEKTGGFVAEKGEVVAEKGEVVAEKDKIALNPSSLNPSSLNPESGIMNPSYRPAGQRGSNSELIGNQEEEKNGSFDLTAPGLSTAWCFHLARKRNRRPADDPIDMTPTFAELLKLGTSAERIHAEIVRPARDKSEHFWQFKQRLVGDGKTLNQDQFSASLRKHLLENEAKKEKERNKNGNVRL